MRRGLRQAAVAVALIALTQFPFWLMQVRLSVQRPVFNLDLFVAALILVFSRPWGIAALCAGWLIEINHDAAATYHFIDVGDFLDSARFLDLVKLGQILSWQVLACIALLAACAVLAWRLAAVRPRPTWALVALTVIAFGADAVNGSGHALGVDRDRPLLSVNVAGSPALSAAHMIVVNRERTAEPMERLEDPRLFRLAQSWRAAHPGGTELVVLVESMGLPQSAAIRDWLAGRLDTPRIEQRWGVQRTDEAFHGPTVYGELRVLCGLQGHYSRLKPAEEAQCLPRQVDATGGQARALHGFNLRMFDREHWWRDLGLEPQDLSAESAVPANMNCNDAFAGVCDGVVLGRATALAESAGRLVYVVTLDTHLPLPGRDIAMPPALGALCPREGLTPTACAMVARLGHVLAQLEADLAGMAHPPLVLVEGDHAPPFLDSTTRGAFDPSRIPAFFLQPRDRGETSVQ